MPREDPTVPGYIGPMQKSLVLRPGVVLYIVVMSIPDRLQSNEARRAYSLRTGASLQCVGIRLPLRKRERTYLPNKKRRRKGK